MARKLVSRPRCLDCEYHYTHTKSNPEILGGTLLQFGHNYCKAKKKARHFKSHDPKIYVPSWCPRLKLPAEYRVYAYKDTDTWYLNHVMMGGQFPPSGYQCAVRLSGTTNVSAASFWDDVKYTSPSKLLGFPINTDEILEIDDGVKPYFFHIKDGVVDIIPLFDSITAQKNTYTPNETIDASL